MGGHLVTLLGQPGRRASLHEAAVYPVLEDGVMQGQAEPSGMARCQAFAGRFGCLRIGQARCRNGLVHRIAVADLGDAAVAVGLHLEVEGSGFVRGGLGNKVAVQEVEEIVADLCELLLPTRAVLPCVLRLLLVALGCLLLLGVRGAAPCVPLAAHSVPEG
eukprot:2299087-Lingulodinium_polyedra.AAC.1